MELEIQGIWLDNDNIHKETIGEVYIETISGKPNMPDELEIDGYHYHIKK